MTFEEKFLLQYNGNYDKPPTSISFYKKMAYAKLIQIVIVMSKGNVGL